MSLFNGNNIHNITRAIMANALSRINSLTEAQILADSPEDIAGRLIADLVPVLPTIDRDGIEMERSSAQTGSSYGHTTHYYEFFIPFSGPRAVFEYQPSTATLGGVQLELRANDLVFRARADDPNAQNSLASILDEVEKHLRQLERDLAVWPREIQKMALELLPPRRKAIEAAKEGLNKFPFKVRRRDDAPLTYAAPEIKRKVAPAQPVRSATNIAPEPILEEAEYQHILKVMDNMTHVLERSPRAFIGLDEESIRTHFLVQLNGQYEGQATGETFNSEGKTDILVRIEDRNVFIAECKFWKGEAVLTDTINQLLGYLTWRDAKTALVFFNRNKDFSKVIEAALNGVLKHPNFESGPKTFGDTTFRYVMLSKSDPNRKVSMTMMLYDIPTT